MSITKLYNQGVFIYYVDHRGATEAESLALITEFVEMIKDVKEKVRVIYDFRGVDISNKMLREFYYYGQEYAESRTLIAGLLGIDGVKQILLKVYLSITKSQTLTVFQDFEEAKSAVANYQQNQYV